jgi:osomolarity two-component system, response regulator SSK1
LVLPPATTARGTTKLSNLDIIKRAFKAVQAAYATIDSGRIDSSSSTLHSLPKPGIMDLDFASQRSGISIDDKFRIGNEEAYSPSLPPPRLSRAFSLPVSSELGHLQRPKASIDIEDPKIGASSNAIGNNYNDIAVELADLVQMVIQTLLQISPPHLLDPVREQLSGCTLQVPTPSVSALFTSMKMLNYISKNMAVFTSQKGATPTLSDQNQFDIGELLQNVGDALSGIAAENAVDLVIFQTDTSLKDLAIRADECALTYALCSVSLLAASYGL